MTRAMKMLGYVAVAGVMMGVWMNLGDIRRYIKIERM